VKPLEPRVFETREWLGTPSLVYSALQPIFEVEPGDVECPDLVSVCHPDMAWAEGGHLFLLSGHVNIPSLNFVTDKNPVQECRSTEHRGRCTTSSR